jgi:hypothetical protein
VIKEIKFCEIKHRSQADNIYEKELNIGISNQFIEMKKSNIPNAGIGIFAKKNFRVDEIIEKCHMIILDRRLTFPHDPQVNRYVYGCHCDCQECKKYGHKAAISLGFGSIYNTALNAEDANAKYYINIHTPVQIVICKKPIKVGEEILVYYGPNYINSYIKNSAKNRT